MPASFSDLLEVHGADAALLKELNRPLTVYLSPFVTPVFSPKQRKEPVLAVCVSLQSSLEGEPDVLTPEVVSTDKITTAIRVSLAAGMHQKEKFTGGPSSC